MTTTRFSYERKNNQYIVYRVKEWRDEDGYHINFEAFKKAKTRKAAYEEVLKLNADMKTLINNHKDLRQAVNF